MVKPHPDYSERANMLGIVQKVWPDNTITAVWQGQMKTYSLDPKCLFFLRRERCQLADIKPGMKIRVDGKPAVRVEAIDPTDTF